MSSSASAGRAPFRRRGSLRLSLIAVLGAMGLVPLASVAWELISINRNALERLVQERQLLQASAIGRLVRAEIDGGLENLVRLAPALGAALARTGGAPDSVIRRLLDDGADEGTALLHFRGIQGEEVATTASATISPELKRLLDLRFLETAESLAGGPDRSRLLYGSEPVFFGRPRPRMVLIASAPVLRGGSFRGVLSAVLDLQALWERTAEKTAGSTTILAVDTEGRVLASSDPVRIAPGQSLSESARAQLVGRREAVTFRFEVPHEDYIERFIGAYSPEGPWGVLVQTPQADVYAPIPQMVRETGKGAALALALAVLTAILFGGRISRPIQHLAAASRRFADGQFGVRAEIRSRNEIGELAHTFNAMAADIEEYIRRVQQAARENLELFMGTIDALTEAIDAKDPYTRGHSARVTEYSVIIAAQMGLPEKELQTIRVAARLHDVGKIAIDDAVLRKPGALDASEFELMKTHPVRGETIMAPIKQMKDMLPGLRNHHEKWAGGGYPDGLREEAIPLMARIIAVADTFDATTTERPYQRAMTPEQAASRINELAGVALDPTVVEAFNRAFRAGAFASVLVSESRDAKPSLATA